VAWTGRYEPAKTDRITGRLQALSSLGRVSPVGREQSEG